MDDALSPQLLSRQLPPQFSVCVSLRSSIPCLVAFTNVYSLTARGAEREENRRFFFTETALGS
jgi:hypothetical protein